MGQVANIIPAAASAIGGLIGGKKKQKFELPAFIQQPLEGLLSQAQQAAAQVPRTPFPGPFFAGPTDAQKLGISNLMASADQLGRVGNLVIDLGAGLASSQVPKLPIFSDIRVEPIQRVVEATTRPLVQSVLEQALPALRSNAIAAGADTGTQATRVLPQLVLRDLGQTVADTAARTAFQELQAQRAAIPQFFGLDLARQQLASDILGSVAPQLLQLPGQLQLQAGTIEQGLNQIALDNALAQFQEQVTAPFRGLDMLSQIIAVALGSGAGMTTQKSRGDPGGAFGALAQTILDAFGKGG